jgi:hypothetical protein
MMITNFRFKQFLLSVCITLALAACSSANTDELVRCAENPDIDDGCGSYKGRDEPEWREGTVVLPPLPKAENLRAIDAYEARKEYEYLLDRASIVRGADGVMRYTIVVRLPNGKDSIFHEGIRCVTNEARTFAYASSSGVFRRSSGVTWKRVERAGVRGYQSYLAHAIMCDRHGYDWDASNAVTALDEQWSVN